MDKTKGAEIIAEITAEIERMQQTYESLDEIYQQEIRRMHEAIVEEGKQAIAEIESLMRLSSLEDLVPAN